MNSSMIGGIDLVFEAAREGFDVYSILDAVMEKWPDGLFQDANEEAVLPLTAVLTDPGAGASHEFFVYKDRASTDSWEREGWTEEHGNEMLHFLVVEDASRPEILQLTLVIGAATVETFDVVAAVFNALDRMASERSVLRERSRRIDWDAELRAAGYALGKEQFYAKVEELSHVLFPDWTADELACHPHEALQFCEVVRQRVALVPDHLVMKALLNRRKQRKKETKSIEPRLVWSSLPTKP